MGDWADGVANKLVNEHGFSAESIEWLVAQALRKAKADGMRSAADAMMVDSASYEGNLASLHVELYDRASKIERGEWP